MINLKEDFNKRLGVNLKNKIFCNFNNQNYQIDEICSYYFYVISRINITSNTVILLCNPSIESHILSFFLILSKYDVFLINRFSEELIKNYEDPTIITFDENLYKKEKKFWNFIFSPSIDEFIKWIHPSFDVVKLIENYIQNNKIGKSIFMSSGSTGIPKLIPLTYDQINNCYLNVKEGFLEKFNLSNIVSVHDTSFVIILPFLFALSCKPNTRLFACKSKASKNPILNFGNFFEYIDKFTIISVPSVYRIILKLFQDKFEKNIKNSNIITCGEPLDKKLALAIFNNQPKFFLNLYGSTEVAPWIIFLNINDYLAKFSNYNLVPSILPAGQTLPNVDYLISNEEELLVNSKSQFSGYLNQENKNVFKKIKSNIYFRTGDLFNKKDNLLFCKGRINSSLKIGGSFVNPILLEILIKEKLGIENMIIIPSIEDCKLILVIFSSELNYLNSTNINKIRKIINEKTSISIPLKFIQNEENINYLRSGKINRKFYSQQYLSHVDS